MISIFLLCQWNSEDIVYQLQKLLCTQNIKMRNSTFSNACINFFFSALILEEIAIDSHNKAIEERLLQEAQDLHLSSLALAKTHFGENNVQTAKHYGNLGRLYQSMHRFHVSK